MRKYPRLYVRLPIESDSVYIKEELRSIAGKLGYTSPYHVNTKNPSIAELLIAIVSGEIVICPFDDTDYQRAIDALAPHVEAREMWAISLTSAIRSALDRMAEAEAHEMGLDEQD